MGTLEFTDITARLAAWLFPAGIDGVVAMAGGGVVPAALVAQLLGVGIKVTARNCRDEANALRFAEPKLLTALPEIRVWRRVLLVDRGSVTGKSWQAARAWLPAEMERVPFVMKGRAQFALIRDVDGGVQWPWRTY